MPDKSNVDLPCECLSSQRFYPISAILNTTTTIIMPRQDEKDYNDLFRCHHKLRTKYQQVVEKHKASLQKIKKLSNEISTLKLRQQAPPATPSDGCLRKHSHQDPEKDEKNELLEVISKRLTNAEKELYLLRSEHRTESASNNNSRQNKSDDESQIQIASLKTHLHELATQHKLDTLRLNLQEEKLRKIIALHNEYTARHAMLKKELQCCEAERNQLEEYKEEVVELREQNHYLEEQVTKLCDLGNNEEEVQMLKDKLLQKESAHDMLLEEVIKLQGENERLRLMLRQSDQKAKDIKSRYRKLEDLALEEAKLSESIDDSSSDTDS